jgi:A/G-specific adenine glycosylase
MTSEGCHQFDETAKRRWRNQLLVWYDRHRRELPWRRDRDPYHVWLSEIMLQQTRVSAVPEHYRRFLLRFPTVRKLAGAREASVLAAWSGLGYYRRARMLHSAAKVVVKRYRGKVPGGLAELRALPGIGRYTAAAIASIAFDVPSAVVDGNVERVLQRVFGSGGRRNDPWRRAEELLDHVRPGDFNQAMMELGATVCLSGQPRCPVCPVFDLCATQGRFEKTCKTIRQRRREICYALDSRDNSILLVQRPKEASLMPGMWELPEVSENGAGKRPSLTLRHSITVTDYVVRVLHGPAQSAPAGRWVKKNRVTRLPLTGLARKILRRAEII